MCSQVRSRTVWKSAQQGPRRSHAKDLTIRFDEVSQLRALALQVVRVQRFCIIASKKHGIICRGPRKEVLNVDKIE